MSHAVMFCLLLLFTFVEFIYSQNIQITNDASTQAWYLTFTIQNTEGPCDSFNGLNSNNVQVWHNNAWQTSNPVIANEANGIRYSWNGGGSAFVLPISMKILTTNHPEGIEFINIITNFNTNHLGVFDTGRPFCTQQPTNTAKTTATPIIGTPNIETPPPRGPPILIPPTLSNPHTPANHPVMECKLPNTDQAGCAGRITNLVNAVQNFAVKCDNVGACAGSTFNFQYTNHLIERVEQISFSERYAGYGATIVMDSTDSARNQYIGKLECKAMAACMNTRVELVGGASVNDVNCPNPSFCPNCEILDCARNPIPGQPKLCGAPKPCFNY